MALLKRLLPAALLATTATAFPYNTFDGPGHPACNDVASVVNATSVAEIQSLVRDAASSGTPVRASGKGHMWYDTMCASNTSSTVVVRTEYVNAIYDLDLPAGADRGTVMIEAGVTFFQLAEWLHARGASVGYTLVNWNITLAGSVAMGAHRSSLREDSMVAAGAEEIHIVDGTGEIRVVERGDGTGEEWLAASTSLGLLGVIVRMKFRVYPDFKVYAKQDM